MVERKEGSFIIMERKKTKRIKIQQKALKRANYVVEIRVEKGTKHYNVIAPKKKRVLEIIEKPQGDVIVKRRGKYYYGEKIKLTIEDGKVVAICKKTVAFNVVERMKIRE